MTTENKNLFGEFIQGKALATFGGKEDLYAFLGICEHRGLRWNSGREALSFVPLYKKDLVIYHTNGRLTYGGLTDETESGRSLILLTNGEFSRLGCETTEVREMTLEEIEEALGHPIRIVTTH
jgi:hypothetical protein